MDFFKKLFGKKDPPRPTMPSTPAQQKPPSSSAPIQKAHANPIEQKADPIRVYDAYGRECFFTREQWRTSVLPGTIRQKWNAPEELYTIIVNALQDGFRAEVVAAAEHLYKLAPSSRTTCVWGVILMEENRLDESEKAFKVFLAKSGDDGYILTNLAKVYSARKNESMAQATLWHALEVDPNQSNALMWYQAQQREQGGPLAELQGLTRIAALPRSWRAQLWLARTALDSNDLPKAIAFYNDSLSHAENPIPADLLKQMSGDLGLHGHLQELLTMTKPHFDAKFHGLEVGNNLIKGYLDTGQIAEARQILEQLFTLNRPDWKSALAYWDNEIAKARIESKELSPDEPLKMNLLTTGSPIWIVKDSPIETLRTPKAADSVKIAVLGCTAQTSNQPKIVKQQMADGPGRLSRAVPFFLAEQLQFCTDADISVLTPWITEPNCGFALMGQPWTTEDAAAHARQISPPADYVVVTHLLTDQDPWKVELRLIKTIDAQCIGRLNISFPSGAPQDAIPQLANLVISLLVEHNIAAPQSPPAFYQIPEPPQFANYLLRLEQLLAVRCSTMDNVRKDFLNGPREIIDGNIQLCLACPLNPTTRFLLAQTLLSLKKAQPEIPKEFEESLKLLQKEKPLPSPMNAVAQKIIDESLSAAPA